jgi:broad specificity phosphatase PhoE
MSGVADLHRMGPARLVLVRHAESVGNVADLKAREAGAARLDLDLRDADVPLSDRGEEQAAALGRFVSRLGPTATPTFVVSSPYRRAADTARTTLAASPSHVEVVLDERLRERELGAFDGLTGVGIRKEYPDEAARRDRLGKFYYRPPGGESWCDVALRVRSFLRDVGTRPAPDRVWVFTHQAVITCFRYVLEGLTEDEVLAVDREVQVANTAVTTYEGTGGRVRLLGFNEAEHLDEVGEDVTAEPGAEERAHDGA